MKKVLFLVLFILAIVVFIVHWLLPEVQNNQPTTSNEASRNNFWEIQSIDTMKYSRDLAREKLSDPKFDEVIDIQLKNIAETGATHVAIGTPYDDEFLPILKRWVGLARKYNLKVWFRGNWSGWEGWFDYAKKMTREDHIIATKKFIINNSDLFEDGDIFNGCPECENGGPGDPRQNGDTKGHRQFLIQEYATTRQAFEKIGKKVQSNLFSMNGDVARIVMDHETTKALGGFVTIDHYVKTPEKLADDISEIAEKSGGKIILGEIGVFLPDTHGRLTERQRAQWLEESLDKLSRIKSLRGINYWTNIGGSTALWQKNNISSELVPILKKYYSPKIVFGRVRDELGVPIQNAAVLFGGKRVFSNEKGYFEILTTKMDDLEIKVSAEGYFEYNREISDRDIDQLNLILIKRDMDRKDKVKFFLKNNFVN